MTCVKASKLDLRGPFHIEISPADVVDGLIVDHEGTVGVLKGGVSGEDGVVWLDDGGGDLGSGVNSELELGLLSVVDGETLHEQGGETRAGAAAEAVEYQETLETCALVRLYEANAKNNMQSYFDNLKLQIQDMF